MATTLYTTDIQKLYVAYFNRPADVKGLEYWEGIVAAAKGSTAAVSAEFAKSAEYKATFANMTPQQVVTQIYQNLFNRAPEAAGLNFWATDLAAGKITIDNVVKAIADGAQLSDKTAYTNKVAAAVAFTQALDTPAEIAAYEKPAAGPAAKAFISSITTDATLTAALVPATLAASVEKVMTAALTGSAFSMALTQDNLVGTENNDTFTGRIFDNSNTFQSGDRIDGGAGNDDRLNVDVGDSQRFAITGETTGVETVSFRAQTLKLENDNPDNNLVNSEVQIDAQRMFGVTQWESNNSRADLIIEDVRILNNQITKDITIAMVETDPGHVDFGFYFDQYSLRASTNETNTLSLQVIDTRSAAAGLDPLKENPYNGFAFYYRGVLTTVKSAAIGDAQTYDALVTAINAQLKAQGLVNITATKSTNFTVLDTEGKPVTGSEIILKSVTAGDTIDSLGTGAGWIADGAVPPSSGLHTKMSNAASNQGDLVTSKIILDDVGRGSTGGDLVVGGLSVGTTSTSLGVQRFEIEVRDNSKLQTINSTNNTLREVTIKNGVTTAIPNSSPYFEIVKDKGNLTVLGNDSLGNAGVNTPLPGVTGSLNGGEQHNQFGFNDVRLIDASAMTGKFVFDAQVTVASLAKYLNLVDGQVAFPAASTDNVAFQYIGGANDDTMTVQINGDVAASRSTLMVGREDFTFNATGGAGNDNITLSIVSTTGGNTGGIQNWYNNQVINNNVTIDAGDGNDVVRKLGAGNTTITTGAGDDTIYADNTGVLVPGAALNNGRATYVFNALDGDAVAAGNQYWYADLRSQPGASINAVNAQVQVDYRGLTKTVTIANSLNSLTNVAITDLLINQAIKEAINNDPVLNKLLIAEDGPARTLIVRALTDGDHTLANLVISFPTVALNVSQLAVAPALTQFTAAGALTVVDGYTTTNFAQYDAAGASGSAAVAAVAEVQSIGLSAEPVAVLGTLTFNINGANFVYTNNTAGALNGAALVTDIVATLAVAGYTLTAGAVTTDLVVTANVAGTDIPAITVLNSTPDGAAPVSTTTANGAPAVAAVAAASLQTGADSIHISDNVITPGLGNDVIVLGTHIGADALNSSNDRVVYAAGAFGNDTIVNFDATGFAIDTLNFTALGGAAAGFANAITAVDKSINVVLESAANDTTAEIAALYTDSLTAVSHVFVAYDANNVGKVYTVVDGAGVAAGSVVVTLVGTIDLADTGWGTLTAANFV